MVNINLFLNWYKKCRVDSESPLENGNVVVEFIGIVMALLVPITFVSTSCWEVARTYLALSSAAHASARAYVVTELESTAHSRSTRVVKAVLTERGIPVSSTHTKIVCSANPCLTPAGLVTVSIRRDVVISVPVFGKRSVIVWGTHTAVVDEAR